MRAALAAALLALSGCAREGPAVTLKTSMGDIKFVLYDKTAPRTSANFLALAKGEKEWLDPRDGKRKRAPLYDGLTFHRVVPSFYIQTGDPAGDGSGDVGFAIEDEKGALGRFDRAGLVGMANFGPNSGASQFFITLSPQPDLDGKHAIFGEVVSGLDVAKAIASVPRDESFGRDKPLRAVYLERVVVEVR